MTLKIQKVSEGWGSTIRLIGRIRSAHLPELKEQLENAGPSIVLDLEDVSLVDVDVVRFLRNCEAQGAQVLHCSPYIREWMAREMDAENTR
jgi:anti-anti-sigma regulatory factor